MLRLIVPMNYGRTQSEKHAMCEKKLAAVCLCILAVAPLAMSLGEDLDLIGWNGDTFDPQAVFGDAESGPVKISDRPQAYVWQNFISKDEARHIAELAAPHLKRSRVGTNHSSIEGRTSYGAFIVRYQDEVIAAVEDRAAAWTGVPVANQEGIQVCSFTFIVFASPFSSPFKGYRLFCMSIKILGFDQSVQVLRYSEGQTYKQHMDGMGRMATMLIYLSDTPSGGETAFPRTNDSDWLDLSLKPHGLSACAEGHVAVKPEIGTALLFYSLPPTADKDIDLREEVDRASLHTGCPPTGDGGSLKWTATIWTHVDKYGAFNPTLPKRLPPDPAICKDQKQQCQAWADAGECERNKVYMTGDEAIGGSSAGHCRRACGVCSACADDDEDCWTAEREKLGLLGNLKRELSTLFGDGR